jgi:8-oxo-dGTP diphosphatase
MSSKEYIPPVVTVDAVIFQIIDSLLCVCLTKRSNDPFKDHWALPGGYSAAGETTMGALNKIIKNKAGISLEKDTKYLEQLYTFDSVARDPRGHAVSVTYMACGLNIKPNGEKELTKFFPVENLPETAFDHKDIIKSAHKRLASKISYTNVIYALLPEKFTLSQLQSAYESVFGHELDKRNFRKKFLQLGLISETNEYLREGAHRPARLYTFKNKKLQTLVRTFD